ncbi:hypothetical protein ACX3VG_08560 [Escherichia coli]
MRCVVSGLVTNDVTNKTDALVDPHRSRNEDGIRDDVESRGLGDVYKRQD